MKTLTPLLILFYAGCVTPNEREQMLRSQGIVLPDTITVVVNHQQSWNLGSPEAYALWKYPNYRVARTTFRGIANDPDIFYEVKLVKK